MTSYLKVINIGGTDVLIFIDNGQSVFKIGDRKAQDLIRSWDQLSSYVDGQGVSNGNFKLGGWLNIGRYKANFLLSQKSIIEKFANGNMNSPETETVKQEIINRFDRAGLFKSSI